MALVSSGRIVCTELEEAPKTALICGKYFDAECQNHMLDIARWLKSEKNMHVIVPKELNSTEFPGEDTADLSLVDLVIGVGGDGTLLHINSLFPKKVPLVIAFNLGSLGFLTVFQIENFRSVITDLLEGKLKVLHRSRLTINVKRLHANANTPQESFVSLNEAVIDKIAGSGICTLDTYCDNHLITTVTGDGLIVGTATGSTAYNLAAGGSMVHPLLSAILFTPICPHSLSFRPVILPDFVTVRIEVAPDARNSCILSVDGRQKLELKKGDAIEVTTSPHPMPTLCATDETSEWFSALARCLMWNVRTRQKTNL